MIRIVVQSSGGRVGVLVVRSGTLAGAIAPRLSPPVAPDGGRRLPTDGGRRLLTDGGRRLLTDGGEPVVRPDDPGAFFDRSPDPIVAYEFGDGGAEILAVNPAFEETFGCKEDQVVGDPLDEVVLAVGHEGGHDAILDPGGSVEAELRCRTIEGVRVFLLRSSPLSGGDRQRGYGVYTDISEHKRVEQRFSALVNSSSDLLAILDRDGRFSYVSPSVETLLGYDPEDLVGERALERIHPEDREAVAQRLLDDPLEWAGQTRSATYRFEDAGGDWRILESAAKSRLHDPAVDGIVFNSRDVTEREQRKTELELYETIVQTVPVGAIVLDETGEVRKINERGADMLGLRPGELEGRAFPDLVEWGMIEESVVEEYGRVVDELLDEPPDAHRKLPEVRVTTADATERVVDIHLGLLPYDDEFRGTVNAFRDITERKAYEGGLERQNRRLEQFASFVSHDLRNPLNVAQGYLEAALESGDEAAIEEIGVSLDRMEELISDLLALARHGHEVTETDPVSLRAVVEAAWSTVSTADATIEVDTDAVVLADERQLRQLFENLIRNAVEHAGDDVAMRVGLVERGFFVADDGPGIPPDERDRVLEVGYTTSEDGTGFGLGIVAQIVEAHGWSIDVTDGEEGGARFEVGNVEFD